MTGLSVKKLTSLLMASLLSACVSKGMLNPTPAVNSPETAANITILRSVGHEALSDDFIFTINGVDTYNFGEGNEFKFVLGEGSYIFGYKYGLFQKPCSVDVEITAGTDYIFNLEPDCVIELE